jgi:hypothetical protein
MEARRNAKKRSRPPLSALAKRKAPPREYLDADAKESKGDAPASGAESAESALRAQKAQWKKFKKCVPRAAPALSHTQHSPPRADRQARSKLNRAQQKKDIRVYNSLITEFGNAKQFGYALAGAQARARPGDACRSSVLTRRLRYTWQPSRR